MSLDRRRLIISASLGALSASIPASAETAPKPRRISQEELDENLLLNWRWRAGEPNGKRANFAGCDLSGLELRSEIDGQQLLIEGMDFTQANLRETYGIEVCFSNCLMRRSRFDGANYPVVAMFRRCDMSEVSACNISWGCGRPAGQSIAIFRDVCLDWA